MTKNAKTFNVSITPYGERRLSYSPGGGEGWKLPAGHYTPAKMPMVVVHPNPGASANAQHLWAHPNVEYRQPICIQGGAWPFKYEIITGPSSSVNIGSTLVYNTSSKTFDVPYDYGVLRWTPTANGTSQNFTIRVTDQDNNSNDITWTVNVDSNKFVFVANNAPGGGSGNISSNVTWTECFGPLASTSNNAGKIAIFRGGIYQCTKFTDDASFDLNGAKKPKSWLAFPGETPIFDLGGTTANGCVRFIFNNSATNAMDDCAFIGITFRNANHNQNNSHYFWATTLFVRCLYWRNYFEYLEKGLVGNDNPACIFFSNVGDLITTFRDYYAIVQNTFDGMQIGGGNGVAATDSYSIRYGLWEHNVYKNCRSSYLAWRKEFHQNTTRRNDIAVANNKCGSGTFIESYANEGNIFGSSNNEICWSRGITLDPSYTVYRQHGGGTALMDINKDSFAYRNTLIGSVYYYQSPTPTFFSNNDVISDSTYAGQITDEVLIPKQHVDENGNLISSSRRNYLGLYGAEVS